MQTVEDWVPGIQFTIVDTLSGQELQWNTKDWGAIELPNARLVPQENVQ